jgi:glycosyltransferase involved in cell wall biosynthesis
MCGNWIAVSKHAFGLTKDSFPGLSPNRSSLVYNPIRTGTPSQCAPFEATQAFVLHAGYVSVSKGAVLLAEAAKQFLKEFPHVHLVYAGTVLGENGKKPGDEGAGRGVDELILETLDSELAKRCHFTGFIEHSRLLGLMRRARVFVFPSSLETFGLVVTEAMLQGCPVVVPDTGPFNEYVVHEQTGLLAEISSPTAFAECVIRMLRDPVLRQRLSVAGQQMVRDQFTLERNIEKSLAFYEECIRNKNGAIVKLASNAESLGTVFARNKE